MKTFVKVKTQFTGFHQWPDAPEEVSFLRNQHRHVFHVYLTVKIDRDRGVEFFILQRQLIECLDKILAWDYIQYEAILGSTSCEEIAGEILKYFNNVLGMPVHEVEVLEDNENGSIVRMS